MADVKDMDSLALNQTAYVVLGMLSYGHSLSGYELRSWATRSLGAFYKPPAQSQIYRELASLEARGLVTSTDVAGSEAPDKTVFTLTDDGRRCLESWVAGGTTSAMVLKHPLAVQTSFAAGVDPTDLIARIDAHINTTLAQLQDLEDLVVGLDDDPGAALARAAIDWALEIRRADIAGAQRAIAALAAPAARGS